MLNGMRHFAFPVATSRTDLSPEDSANTSRPLIGVCQITPPKTPTRGPWKKLEKLTCPPGPLNGLRLLKEGKIRANGLRNVPISDRRPQPSPAVKSRSPKRFEATTYSVP